MEERRYTVGRDLMPLKVTDVENNITHILLFIAGAGSESGSTGMCVSQVWGCRGGGDRRTVSGRR